MAARHVAGKKAASAVKRAADFKQAMDNPQESIAVVMGYNARAGEHARRAHPGAVDDTKVIPDDLSWEEVQNHAAERLAELRTLNKKQYREEMKKIVVHSLEILKEVLAPIVELIALKKFDMQEAKRAAEAFGDFLAGGDDYEEHEPVQREGAELGQTLKKACKKRRAFEAHGKEAQAMASAADYTDEWYHIPDKNVSFRTFYLCGRQWGAERCTTLTVSSLWDRLKTDPLASGQRWYCPVCKARYKTSNGVMVEMMIQGVSYYLKAPFPTDDIIDLKAMAVERYHAGAKSPEELLKAIPEAHPVGAEWLVATEHDGTYSYQEAVFEDIPSLNWDQLYNAV